MAQTYTKILDDIGLPPMFSGLYVCGNDDGDLAIFASGGDGPLHVKITARLVLGFSSYEEFCHPDQDMHNVDARPPYSDPENKIYYPALLVHNSRWLQSFSEGRLVTWGESAAHYQFLSYGRIVDIIGGAPPEAKIIETAEYDEFVRNIDHAVS